MSADLLVMSPVSKVGGSERVAFYIAKHLARRGHKVHAMIKSPVQSREMLGWYQKEKIPIALTPHLKPLKPARLIPSMIALSLKVSRIRPYAVNLHNPGNTILFTDVLALKLAGVKKIVCTVHHPIDPETLPASWKKSTVLASKYADWVVVQSPALDITMQTIGVASPKIKLIPLAVETGDHEIDKASARRQLGLPEKQFVVGTLGRLAKDKRVEQVIQACAESQPFRDRGFLVVAGDGAERPRLAAMAQKLLPGQHKFLGTIEDTAPFYAALDLFALVSELEGFGMVYIEAGSWSVPSLGCDSGGTPYAIKDGKTGFLVPANQPEKMREPLDLLMTDSQGLQIMGEAARQFAESNFSMERMADSYEEAFGLTRR